MNKISLKYEFHIPDILSDCDINLEIINIDEIDEKLCYKPITTIKSIRKFVQCDKTSIKNVSLKNFDKLINPLSEVSTVSAKDKRKVANIIKGDKKHRLTYTSI